MVTLLKTGDVFMEGWKKNVDIWGTQCCCSVPELLVHFCLGLSKLKQHKSLDVCLKQTYTSSSFANRTEQHPWMESFISWYAVQLSCPARIPGDLSMRGTLSEELWSLAEMYTVLAPTAPTESHRTKSLWGHSSAGTQPHGLRQGWLLLSSGTWCMSCTCCCWHPGGLPCLKIFCCIALDSQRTGLPLYLVVLIAVVCGAVVFLVISLIMCVRKPKDGE